MAALSTHTWHSVMRRRSLEESNMVAGVLLWIALAAFVPYVLTPGVEHVIRQDGKPTTSVPQDVPGSSPANVAPGAPAVSPGAAAPAAAPSTSFAGSAAATRLPASWRDAS
jgi:hypothetical protein